MDLHLGKQIGASLLILTNTVLLVWAILIYRRRQSLPDRFYALLAVSPVIALFQWALGLGLYGQGTSPKGMHVFYGVMVGLGAVAQATLRRTTSLGQRYRARPLVYAFVSLFVALLTARSWMSR